MSIEQGTLRLWPEQGMVCVLTMNVCKPITRHSQLGKRHTGTVDPRTAAPAGINRPP